MVDAPERIWVASVTENYGEWQTTTDGLPRPTEYTRSDLVAELAAENERLKELVRWAHETLYEINPSNYDHDEVCKLNDASVEVILGLAHHLGESHGKTDAWWQDHLASSSVPRAEVLSRTGAVKVSREDVAKMVYEGMSWAAMCGPTPNGTVPVWEDRGNSLGQDEARRIADRILSAIDTHPRATSTVEDHKAGNVSGKTSFEQELAGRSVELFQAQTTTDPEIAAALGRVDRADLYLTTPAPEGQQPVAKAVELSGNAGELIEKMAEAIRGDTTSDDTPWAALSEDRKTGWRGDAERALAVVKEYLTARRPSEQAVTEAAGPFVTFANHAIEKTDDGWVWRTSGNERICDWFGPSDFGALKAAMEAGR